MRSPACLLLLVFFAVPPVLLAQPAAPTPEKLVSDLRFLKSVLEEAHPSLYRYISRDSLNQLFDETIKKIDHPLSKTAYKQLAQTFVGAIGSGHTYINPSVALYNPAIQSCFPFLVSARGNKLYIVKGIGNADDRFAGQEIVSIQGEPAANVLNKVRSCISGEGSSTIYKDYKIEKTIAFVNAIHELYGSPASYDFVLKDSLGNSGSQTITAAAYNNPDRDFVNYLLPALKTADEMRVVSYPATIPATAVLTLKSFNYNGGTENPRFYVGLRDELDRRGIKNLAVDLRGNSGGSFFSTIQVLIFLVQGTFQVADDTFAPVATLSFSDRILNLAANAAAPIVPKPGGGYTLANDAAKRRIVGDNSFKGEVYVLTDGGTFSSASLLAAALRENRKVTIIGQETGGMQDGLDTSPFLTVQLPESKLTLNLPRFYTSAKVSKRNPGRGVLPDITVIPSVQDVRSQTDPVMERLTEIITGKIKRTK